MQKKCNVESGISLERVRVFVSVSWRVRERRTETDNSRSLILNRKTDSQSSEVNFHQSYKELRQPELIRGGTLENCLVFAN